MSKLGSEESGLIKKFEHKGITVKIFFDPDPPNPRTDYDNAGTMVCWHPRSKLGDKHSFRNVDEFKTSLVSDADPTFEECVAEEEDENKIRELRDELIDKHYLMLPLFVYEHGGMTMRTGSFGDRWDSGQVGWVYLSNGDIVKEWGAGFDALDKAKNCLESEVATYADYLEGQVYGYVLEAEDGEQLESCWGCYGRDYVEEEARSAAEEVTACRIARQIAESKGDVVGEQS